MQRSVKSIGMGITVLLIGTAGSVLVPKNAGAGTSLTYNEMETFKQQKQSQIDHIRQAVQDRIQGYSATLQSSTTVSTTPPTLPPKPSFTPGQLSREAWYTLPWSNRADQNVLPTSTWIVDYVPVAQVGTWVPLYASSGAVSGTGYIDLHFLSPTGGIEGNSYVAPGATGAITITTVTGSVISFTTAYGQSGTFNINSHQWSIQVCQTGSRRTGTLRPDCQGGDRA